MVSMEAGRACGYRDDIARLPTLSLGLSSVRLIVNKFESQYTRVNTEDGFQYREIVKYDPNIEDEGYDDYDDSPLDYAKGRVWHRFAGSLTSALSKCIPSVSFGNFGVLAITTGLFAPRMISYLVLYPFCRLVFGTLYPAYASYKAVRTKNLKEYVKWMMYWIVFALFTCTETFTDVFLSWFPFYYEVKIVLVLWLLSPATKGSSILYRKFVHPALCRREQEIDEYIAKAKDQGYHTVLNLGTKGVNYATTVIMQTAIKGGGGLVQQLRKSYSLSDLTECEPRDERGADEADDVLTEPRLIRRPVKGGYATRRSASESNSRSPMYFPEVDVDVRLRPRSDEPDFSHIKSTEDISSGYSSADNSASLSRAASLGAARARSRTTRTTVTTIKRPQAAEGSEVDIEELRDEDGFEYANMPSLVNIPSPLYLSHTDPPFLYHYVGDQVKIVQVLGKNPLSPNINLDTNNTDLWDQKENDLKQGTEESVKQNVELDNNVKTTENTSCEQKSPSIDTNLSISKDDEKDVVQTSNVETEFTVPKQEDLIFHDTVVTSDENVTSVENVTSDENVTNSENVLTKEDDSSKIIVENASIDNLINDEDSAESDDEASFGTPEDSPKSKKRVSKGKYGKSKAPLPPTDTVSVVDDQTEIKNDDDLTKMKSDDDQTNMNSDDDQTNLKNNDDQTKMKNYEDQININNYEEKTDIIVTEPTTPPETLVDIVNSLPDNAFKETGTSQGLQVVNPIAENKRRHKSKSPGRIPKSNSSAIGKLLQLPSKFAFWKSNDKPRSDASNSSGDHSRRSSTVESCAIDEFQSCGDLTKMVPLVSDENDVQTENADPEIACDDASFVDANEGIYNEVIEKSDALQKVIDAKIECHPEYKFVPLHDEIHTTSKSTEV